jgi:hypothetical protein
MCGSGEKSTLGAVQIALSLLLPPQQARFTNILFVASHVVVAAARPSARIMNATTPCAKSFMFNDISL